jgi:hypothetical protein
MHVSSSPCFRWPTLLVCSPQGGKSKEEKKQSFDKKKEKKKKFKEAGGFSGG